MGKDEAVLSRSIWHIEAKSETNSVAVRNRIVVREQGTQQQYRPNSTAGSHCEVEVIFFDKLRKKYRIDPYDTHHV
jgi:hypothetical protein